MAIDNNGPNSHSKRDSTEASRVAAERPIGLTRIHSTDAVDEHTGGGEHGAPCDEFNRALREGMQVRPRVPRI